MGSNRRRALAVAALVLIGFALAACGGGKGTASTGAEASALATSTVVQQARTDAATFFKPCLPQSAAGQVQLAGTLTTKAGRQALLTKCGVPKADDKAAEACWLANIENGGKLPKGVSAKLDVLLADGYPCALKYRATGVSASPTPAASAK
jgi:hypothetical protein